MFREVPSRFDFPKAEREILAFWEQNKVYEKGLEKSKGGKPFVFFEGPPTANGLPHPGHCLTRAIKDLFPRYKTMTGHYCLRKGGWDTHGLPVEVEVCKEMGIHTKEEIEAYGMEKFNRQCLESVFRYTKEWEEMTRRLGFWINLDEAYVTYHQSYIESVWWALKTLFDAGKLYQGYKIVWWWAQGGTALSAGEVGQGYREVDDPSVFVRFPIVMDERARALGLEEPRPSGRAVNDTGGKAASAPSLLVWTTTPWTLPSNMFAAVHRDFDYALVYDEVDSERLIFAEALVEPIAKKLKATKRWRIERRFKGAKLIGLRYKPPFPECYYDVTPVERGAKFQWSPEGQGSWPAPDVQPWSGVQEHLVGGATRDFVAWRVLHADFVSLDTGSGIVHQAPAFGEVDFDLLLKERTGFSDPEAIPLFFNVGPDGKFNLAIPPTWMTTSDFESFRQKYAGRWVKDCDKEICQDMKERGVLVLQEQYRHDYPFCWRAEEDPLIQYPRRSWFISTTQFKDDMLENNQRINWLPEHIKAGRFGKFLESNVDWALSRERYWGTPLPIWVCHACGHREAVESYAKLLDMPGVAGTEVWEAAKRQSPDLSEHLKVHRPYIDAITYDCPKCATKQSRDHVGAVRGAEEGPLPDGRDSECRMQRVPDVIDCWFDSGAMPFAQWGYPHVPGSVDKFLEQFPADFISEALDQTRGWFYSLTAISVMLFGKNGVARGPTNEDLLEAMIADSQTPGRLGTGVPSGGAAAQVADALPNPQSEIRNPKSDYPQPFKTCIVLGLLMGEDGLKMSKSKKNYKEPTYIFEHEGADAMRWLFFSGQTPWTSIRFQESTIAEGQREFLIRLYNCYSFFVIYANIDRWTPAMRPGDDQARGVYTELDRWIISELNECCLDVYQHMEAYDNFGAARALNQFVDGLSNWYVRRSRERFWKSGMDDDKKAAYATLYDCLVTVAKLIAPFTPFIAESVYQNLVRTHDANAPMSVHLCDYPITEATRAEIETRVDHELNAEVDMIRQLVSCGRAARSAAKIRVRQPLAAMELYHRQADVVRTHEDVVRDELNVKRLDYVSATEIDEYVHYEVKPDFKKIGPKFGPLAPKIKAALSDHRDVESLVRALEHEDRCTVDVAGQAVELQRDEVSIELHAKTGYTAERIPGFGILVLDTHLTDALRDEGLARDLVNQIQQTRKNLDLGYEQRIDLAIVGGAHAEGTADLVIHGANRTEETIPSAITGGADIQRVVDQFGTYIMGETLAQAILNQPIPQVQPIRANIEGHEVEIYVKPL